MAAIKDRIKNIKYVFKDHGFIGVVRVVFNGAVVRPLRGKTGYLLYRNRYPQHTIFIAGFAKGGSSWFAHLLSSLPGFQEYKPVKWLLPGEGPHTIDVYEGLVSEFSKKLAVVKGHTWGFPENVGQLKQQQAGKYIVTVRDPRDCLISAYWYVRRLPAHWDYQKASTLSLTEYITDKLESGEFKDLFVAWLENWLNNRDENSILVRYEDLLKNTSGELRRVFDFLGFDVSDDQVVHLIKKQSFERKAKRKRGQENTKSFLRKGISGEWQEVFTEDQKRMAAEQGKEVLHRLAYDLS